MRLGTKSAVLISVGTLLFAILFGVGLFYTITSSHQTTLRLQSKMAAELMRLTITHEMREGSPEHIKPYLEELTSVPGLLDAHVVPAKSVVEQMGIDTSRYPPTQPLEDMVLESGIATEELIDGEQHIFHLGIPYIAGTSCLQCHSGREGDVLGVVSLEIDMSQQRSTMIQSLMGMLLLLFLFGAVLIIALRALMVPIIRTAGAMRKAFAKAEEGDFSARLEKRTDDEMGDISEQTNRIMELMDSNLGTISKEIETLYNAHSGEERRNILQHTVSVVHNMVQAAHFKQAIENDRNLNEVYERLRRELVNRFGISRFSIYEVSNSKNRMQL
ncbi:MAG TPA: hypothetical protein VKA23_03615, partial [Mariprofundaceae bacterium]|nr:hypothetical protein [Mariprofundaceae bacterium]